MKKTSRIIFLFCLLNAVFNSCKKPAPEADYRGSMRTFVEKISTTAKSSNPGFIVIPQNGLALLTDDGTTGGIAQSDYINAIDGVGQEELWYGYDNKDDVLSPEPDHSEMLGLCAFAKTHGLTVLATDYCFTKSKVDDSYARNSSDNFVSFAADHRDLDDVPTYPDEPYNENADTITSLNQIKNYLYIISPSAYGSKEDFINAVAQTNYDAVIMDLFFDENTMLNATDLARMRIKPNGGSRKLICYMSIGEAESYRWYWKKEWNVSPPDFIVGEDPDWLDNYSIRYWDPYWQNIICGSGDSYLNRIQTAGFDGVYLDLVSEYEYFEAK